MLNVFLFDADETWARRLREALAPHASIAVTHVSPASAATTRLEGSRFDVAFIDLSASRNAAPGSLIDEQVARAVPIVALVNPDDDRRVPESLRAADLDGAVRPDPDGDFITALATFAAERGRGRSDRGSQAGAGSDPDIVMMLDRSGLVVYQSPADRDVLGTAPLDLLNSPIWELVHPDDVDEVASAVRGLFADGGSRPIRFEMQHGDGTWHRLTGLGRLAAGGRDAHIIFALRDEVEPAALPASTAVDVRGSVSATPALGDVPGAPAPPTSVGAAGARGHETVLLVDDDNAVRDLIRRMLEYSGYHVLETSLPSAAERIIREFDGTIHLLLTDVVIAEMSGLDLAARVVKERPGLPVMYVSGYPEPTVGDEGGAVPGTHFLPKPFDRQTLLRAVRQAIDSVAG